jgi:hypothetical protein
MRLSKQLLEAAGLSYSPGGMDDAGLIVKLARLSNDVYPGRDAFGVLPLMVIGHESMSDMQWRDWVRQMGAAHYGSGYVERVLVNGIDIKAMEPTGPFGRQIRMCTISRWKSRASRWTYLDAVSSVISVVEKWPSLYNTIAEHLAEQEFTLREFIGHINELPAPAGMPDVEGMTSTLGDIIDGPIGTKPMVLPDY